LGVCVGCGCAAGAVVVTVAVGAGLAVLPALPAVPIEMPMIRHPRHAPIVSRDLRPQVLLSRRDRLRVRILIRHMRWWRSAGRGIPR
jgi:hypothetical protein